MAPLFHPRQPPSDSTAQNSATRPSAPSASLYIEITDSDEDLSQQQQRPSNVAAQFSGTRRAAHTAPSYLELTDSDEDASQQQQQPPSNVAAQYSETHRPAQSALSYLQITDSDEDDDSGSARRDDESLTDIDGGDAQSPEHEDDYMEYFEAEEPASPTPLPPPTSRAATSRPLALVPEEVTCGCPDRAIHGRLKVGKCSACSRILHLACSARSSAAQSGWMCFDCPGETLEVLQYAAQDLAYIDEADLLKDVGTPAVPTAQPTPSVPVAKTKPTERDEIQCVCPSRMSKVRTRLARCQDCGVTAHIACQVRNAAGVPGYTCVLCEGPLENVPDRGVGVGLKRKAISRPVAVKTKAAPKVAKSTPAAKASKVTKPPQKLKLPAVSQKLGEDGEKVLQATPGQVSPKRHNLRQKAVPNMKDRPTRNRPTARQVEKELSKQYDDLSTGLTSKPKEPKRKTKTKTKSEPRITNLHHIFLRNVPTDVLWEHYCKLPNGLVENAAVRKATETDFVSYKVQPINAVPEAWSKELKYRLGLLLDAATSDGQIMHLSAKQWELDVGRALRHLRDMAMEVLHHGSYNGKRSRLGLLAEMLGLSDRGTFWKGREQFTGSQ